MAEFQLERRRYESDEIEAFFVVRKGDEELFSLPVTDLKKEIFQLIIEKSNVGREGREQAGGAAAACEAPAEGPQGESSASNG